VYRFNPVAALVLAMRNILMENQPPPMTLIVNMVIAAALALSIGLLVFGRLKRRFYEYI
jgi:lipopolysaccharide transport system permease protein